MAHTTIVGVDKTDMIEVEITKGAVHIRVGGASLLFWDTEVARAFAEAILAGADRFDSQEIVSGDGNLIYNQEEEDHEAFQEGKAEAS